MKTSLIVTILNEENNIESFLRSILDQSVSPNEVIIVDGGSTDDTLKLIDKTLKGQKQKVTILTKKGNRSVGRNEGIKHAVGDVILLTDAGCMLDKNWVKEIQKPFQDDTVDVVAGYYADNSESIFQKSLVPYAFVMPDKVNKLTFLPATRSMAIRKKVFNEAGGFDTSFSHNEDYVFAKKLKGMNKRIMFAKDAIVYWIPRTSFKQAYIMFWRFAFGDMEAGIIRPKVVALFLRYILGVILIFIVLATQNTSLFVFILIMLTLYIVWAIAKNYHYVKKWQAVYLLPLIQFTADIAVLKGSIQGAKKRYGI